MSPYKGLLLDYGGVLTTPLVEAMDRFAKELDIELQDLARAALGAYAGETDDLVTDFETGRISEDAFSRAFSARLEELTGRRVEPQGLVARLFDVRIEESMIDAVGKVRAAGLKTAIVSNTWGDSLFRRERLEGMFDAVVLSGEVGLRKPDPAIFRHALSRLALEPRDCVFVDDHPGHLEPAAALGMTTVLHMVPARTLSDLQNLLEVPLL